MNDPNDIINTMPVHRVPCITFFCNDSHYVITTHVGIYSNNPLSGYHYLFGELIIKFKYPVQQVMLTISQYTRLSTFSDNMFYLFTAEDRFFVLNFHAKEIKKQIRNIRNQGNTG